MWHVLKGPKVRKAGLGLKGHWLSFLNWQEKMHGCSLLGFNAEPNFPSKINVVPIIK